MAAKKTKCFYCEKRIDTDVRKCPYCGKNQNGNSGFILIIAALIIGLIINYSVGNPASLPDFGLFDSNKNLLEKWDINELTDSEALESLIGKLSPEQLTELSDKIFDDPVWTGENVLDGSGEEFVETEALISFLKQIEPEQLKEWGDPKENKEPLSERFLSLFKSEETGAPAATPERIETVNKEDEEPGFFSSLFSGFGKSREERQQEKALIELYESMGFTKAQAKDLLKTPNNMADSEVTRDFYKAMGFSDEQFEELAAMTPEDFLNGDISEETLNQAVESSLEMTDAFLGEALSEENIKEFSKAMRGNIARVGMDTFSYKPGDTIPGMQNLEWGLVSADDAGLSLTSPDPSVGTVDSETGYVKIRFLLKNTGSETFRPDPFGSGAGVPWLVEHLGDSVPLVFFNSYLLTPGELSPDSSEASLAPGEKKMYTAYYELPPYFSGSYRLELGDSHITFSL